MIILTRIYFFAFDVPNSDEKIPATIYSTLTKEDFNRADNIDFENVIDAFETMKATANPNIADTANAIVLNLLLAYDVSKNIKLLKTAEILNNWEIKNAKYDDENISKINTYQIIKRTRSFTEQEIINLCAIVDETDRHEIKFCVYSLLENYQSAKVYFNKLSENEQMLMREEPIYYFFEEMEKNNG